MGFPRSCPAAATGHDGQHQHGLRAVEFEASSIKGRGARSGARRAAVKPYQNLKTLELSYLKQYLAARAFVLALAAHLRIAVNKVTFALERCTASRIIILRHHASTQALRARGHAPAAPRVARWRCWGPRPGIASAPCLQQFDVDGERLRRARVLSTGLLRHPAQRPYELLAPEDT